MSLIDTTYFIRDINVPLSEKPELNSVFTDAVTEYENEVLLKLLGYQLWKEFTDAVTADAIGEGNEGYVALAQKWIDLRDGAEFSFTWNGQTINTKWNGLINTEKKSLIAYYVYYNHRINHESEYTGIGEVSSKSENAQKVSPLNKMVRVHSQMLDLYGKIPAAAKRYYQFLNSADYRHFNAKPSAYNFLLANVETYSNWVFTPIRNVNAFGI
ncbi:hypothetical protein [Sunxiuqinia indica]|uniref:hypothetical protein n=1 Tax=Sunxiuqinia indica TaxID=2692584 RepID=UPI00135A30ED|nr:hypothetical protein [Sunxiuqinia indica]